MVVVCDRYEEERRQLVEGITEIIGEEEWSKRLARSLLKVSSGVDWNSISIHEHSIHNQSLSGGPKPARDLRQLFGLLVLLRRAWLRIMVFQRWIYLYDKYCYFPLFFVIGVAWAEVRLCLRRDTGSTFFYTSITNISIFSIPHILSWRMSIDDDADASVYIFLRLSNHI